MKPDIFQHNNCLQACFKHREQMTDHELVILSRVAGAYACNEHESGDAIREAEAICNKFACLDQIRRNDAKKVAIDAFVGPVRLNRFGQYHGGCHPAVRHLKV
jgi:hypothetical protein